MRSEVAALERSLAQLSTRRRAIFVAALVEELSYRDIAKRFGMSLRSVEREMAEAFNHCGKSFEKTPGRRRVDTRSGVLQMMARSRTADDGHDK
jgi:RNA polymerase sigma-70 factor (ECF subfamily)